MWILSLILLFVIPLLYYITLFLLSFFWIQSPFLAIPWENFCKIFAKFNYFPARDAWTKQAWPFSMHFLFSKILNIFHRFFLWLKWCWGGLKWECVKSCWQHDCRQFENQRISWKPADLEATKCQLLKKSNLHFL